MMWLAFLEVGAIGFWVVLFASAILVSSLVDRERPGAATLVGIATFVVLALFGDLNPVALVREHPTVAMVAVPAYFLVGVGWSALKWWLFTAKVAMRLAEVGVRFQSHIASESALHRKDIEVAATQIAELEALGKAPDGTDDACTARTRSGNARLSPRDAEQMLSRLRAQRTEFENRLARLHDESWRRSCWERLVRQEGIQFTVDPRLDLSEHKTRILSWMMYWPASMVWTVLGDLVGHIFHLLYDQLRGFFQGIADRRLGNLSNAYKVAAGDR